MAERGCSAEGEKSANPGCILVEELDGLADGLDAEGKGEPDSGPWGCDPSS